MRRLLVRAGLSAMLCAVASAQALPVTDAVPCVVQDKQAAQLPEVSHFNGLVGARLDANAFNRLLKIDEDRLLEGFRRRPGRQAWDGEHAGKWLHAATLAWSYTQDAKLREKLDRVVLELSKCQLDDGYLGTYLPEQRWTEWDVWAHKYDMIGLLTYYRFTGNTNALQTSRRCADLLCRTFGPGRRDILTAGWHAGMAPTSVLEPMVLLYRFSGEQKYLDFCRYILAAWETPSGPKIISTLLSSKRVDKVGDAKAYEMLSCLNGLLELYRTVGDEKMLQVALNAWQDIVDKRLYLTGTASYQEVFHDDYDLPNGNRDVAETCVTVTWIQFNAQLLRLTGEPRFAEELERSVYNQLFGAQKPDGTAWGYYVQLEGTKPYSSELSGHCCLSSGPRGIALIPTFALTTDSNGLVVNFLADGHSQLTLPNARRANLDVASLYPADGKVRLKLGLRASATFTVKVRIPAWSRSPTIAVNGRPEKGAVESGAYASVRREWRDGDVVELNIPIVPRAMVGDHGNKGRVAFACGPLVLAADDGLNPEARIGHFAVLSSDLSRVAFEISPAPKGWASWESARTYSAKAVVKTSPISGAAGNKADLCLVPFAEAGGTLAPYQVWLPCEQPAAANSATRVH